MRMAIHHFPGAIARRGALALIFTCCLLVAPPARAADPQLAFDPALGATLRAGAARVQIDRNERTPALIVRFWPNGASQTLTSPTASWLGPDKLQLAYRAEAPPHRRPLRIIRTLEARADGPSAALLTEQFTLSATQALRSADVEVERPFLITSDAMATTGGELTVIRPHREGWIDTAALGEDPTEGEYRLGGPYPRAPRKISARTLADAAATTSAIAATTPELALPAVQIDGPGWRCAVMADPAAGAFFSVRLGGGGASGVVSYLNRAREVALTSQTRTFAFRLAAGNTPRRPFDGALDAYAALMRQGTAPNPEWAAGVALIETADLAANPRWEDDLRQLANWLTPAERAQVAVVFGGWEGSIFPYGFDRERGAFERAWVLAGDRTRWMSPEALRRALGAAKGLGFRVLLRMGESLAADRGTPYFPEAWAWRGPGGELAATVPAPGAYGPLGLLNPADPRVAEWFTAYTGALLAEFGTQLDGLVLGGMERIPRGAAIGGAHPAWAASATFDLVRAIHLRAAAYNPALVLLTGENPAPGVDTAPYALAADGALNTRGGDPEADLRGLLPCARGVLWDTARDPLVRFPAGEWAARTLGMPLAIGGSGAGALQPSRWSRAQRDRVLKAFAELRQRLAREGAVHYFNESPEGLLASHPDRRPTEEIMPAPAPGELNWAADAATSVTASSGQAGEAGWASAPGRELPQWLRLDFGAPRRLERFVVASFDNAASTTATAANLGLTAYEIQAWDEAKGGWRKLAEVTGDPAVHTRAHALAQPVETRRVRLLVHDVAPLDGVARVARFEAWGR